MICAWKELLGILPQRFRQEVDRHGREGAKEIRLRLGNPPELVLGTKRIHLKDMVSREDLNYCVNSASRYSPWAAATMAKGFLTVPGGHRMGICGCSVVQNGVITGIREVSSLCIRVARDFPGIAADLVGLSGSILILGAPGWGKTTLLRDLICQKAQKGNSIAVVDEREELFPAGVSEIKGIDVMSGCPKAQGVDMLLRTMGPEVIAMDEITAKEDCEALQAAAWCGVTLLATAHASSLRDYLHRPVYEPLVRKNIFEHLVILHADKSWHLERSGAWTANGSARY